MPTYKFFDLGNTKGLKRGKGGLRNDYVVFGMIDHRDKTRKMKQDSVLATEEGLTGKLEELNKWAKEDPEAYRNTDVYFSLNRFGLKSDHGTLVTDRSSGSVKQLAFIGVDIDGYRKGLTANKTIQKVQEMVTKGRIPAPTVILWSHGVQLLWKIKDGASPKVGRFVNLIKEELYARLEFLGSDGVTEDDARMFRLPGSFNPKPGVQCEVKMAFKPELSYTLGELEESLGLPTLADYHKAKASSQGTVNTADGIKKRTNQIINGVGIEGWRAENKGRLMNLVDLPKSDVWEHATGNRNSLVYSVAYYAYLVNQDKDYAKDMVNLAISNMECPLDHGVPESIKSAIKGAKKFITTLEKHRKFEDSPVFKGKVTPQSRATLAHKMGFNVKDSADARKKLREAGLTFLLPSSMQSRKDYMHEYYENVRRDKLNVKDTYENRRKTIEHEAYVVGHIYFNTDVNFAGLSALVSKVLGISKPLSRATLYRRLKAYKQSFKEVSEKARQQLSDAQQELEATFEKFKDSFVKQYGAKFTSYARLEKARREKERIAYEQRHADHLDPEMKASIDAILVQYAM